MNPFAVLSDHDPLPASAALAAAFDKIGGLPHAVGAVEIGGLIGVLACVETVLLGGNAASEDEEKDLSDEQKRQTNGEGAANA